jgi:hypothetical protein
LTQGITSGRLARIAIPATGRDGGASPAEAVRVAGCLFLREFPSLSWRATPI